MDAATIANRIALIFNPQPDMSGQQINRLHGEMRRRVLDLANEIAAGDDDVREYAEQVYAGWAGGDDIGKEMRKLGQALGFDALPPAGGR